MALSGAELLAAGEGLEEDYFTPPQDAREVAMPEARAEPRNSEAGSQDGDATD